MATAANTTQAATSSLTSTVCSLREHIPWPAPILDPVVARNNEFTYDKLRQEILHQVELATTATNWALTGAAAAQGLAMQPFLSGAATSPTATPGGFNSGLAQLAVSLFGLWAAHAGLTFAIGKSIGVIYAGCYLAQLETEDHGWERHLLWARFLTCNGIEPPDHPDDPRSYRRRSSLWRRFQHGIGWFINLDGKGLGLLGAEDRMRACMIAELISIVAAVIYASRWLRLRNVSLRSILDGWDSGRFWSDETLFVALCTWGVGICLVSALRLRQYRLDVTKDVTTVFLRLHEQAAIAYAEATSAQRRSSTSRSMP